MSTNEKNNVKNNVTIVKLPETVKTGGARMPEEKLIIADMKAGKTFEECFQAFQDRRKDSTRDSSKERFITYCKCSKFRKFARQENLSFE